MDQQRLVAEWAWISKNPGSHEDYGVLAASDGQINVGDFVGQYVVGFPNSSIGEDAPAGPPWVTFGSHPTSVKRRVVSVSVQDPWRGQDQAGRPIWPRRFFVCWLREVAEASASYRTLWEAVGGVELPRPDRAPVELTIRPQPLSSIIETIEKIGFEQVAAIAAALLDSPVAVAGTANLRLPDRISLLDAVAALLPYGFRADLSASSAVDNTVAHRMRLVPAEYPNNSQQVIALQGAPLTLRSEPARDYLTMLLDKKAGSGLDAVVAHLWDATPARQPYLFSRPDDALQVLNKLDRHTYKIKAARHGTESLKSSRVFFDDTQAEVARMWRSQEMDEQSRYKLLRPLLSSDDELAAEAWRLHWDAVEEKVITLVNHSLDNGDIDSAERSLAVAEALPHAEAADLLLMKLLVPPGGPSESWQRGFEARALLLRRRDIPLPNTFGKTGIVLRGGQADGWQGHLVKRLLSSVIAEDPTADRAAGWASWLCLSAVEGDLAGWVAALRLMLCGPGGDAAADSVRTLIRQDAVWAAIALQLAVHSGRIGVALEIPGLVEDLIGLAARTGTQPGQDDTRRALATALNVSLWEHRLNPGVIAKVDVARLLLGYRPCNIPGDGTQQEFHHYYEGLKQALGLPSVQNLGVPFQARFLALLVPVGPHQRLSAGAIWLLKAWAADSQLVPVLAHYVAEPDVTKVLLRDSRLDGGFWSPLVVLKPGLRHTLAVPLLRAVVEQTIENPAASLRRHTVAGTGVTGTKLALAMYDAWRSGMRAPQILDVIASVSVNGLDLTRRVTHLMLDNALREFESLLNHPARDEEDHFAAQQRQARAEDMLFEFWTLICNGSLGLEYGTQFRRSLAERLRSEEAARKRARRSLPRGSGLLSRLRGQGTPHMAPEAARPEHAPTARQLPAAAGYLAPVEAATFSPPPAEPPPPEGGHRWWPLGRSGGLRKDKAKDHGLRERP